jgi:HNH endonuclease
VRQFDTIDIMSKISYKSVAIELAYLRTVLEYKPRKGIFIWKVHRASYHGCVRPGDAAGTIETMKSGKKRVAITFNQKRYKAHRLAWLFVTGEWPRGGLDHEDGDGANNKWKNLRPATSSQNGHNRHGTRPDNTSGITGVGRWKTRNKWYARVKVNYKLISLGYFDTRKEAIAARRAGELKYFGKYAPK